MKNFILTTLLLLLSSTLFAQSGEKKGSFDAAQLTQLLIRVEAGMEIVVNSHQKGDLSYEYTFDGNEEAYNHYFKNFDPEFEKQGGEARLILSFPENKKKNTNYKIDKHQLSITVPESIMLRLNSRYSTIHVNNIKRGLLVENRSGKVVVSGIEQMVNIFNEYGEVIATDINGELKIGNRSSKVDVRNVVGPVVLNAEYSKINISGIDGDITMNNRSGVMNAFDIRGSIQTSGPYMEYELSNIDGDVSIENKSGNVMVDGANSLRISGEYTNVTASNISAGEPLHINGRSANIRLSEINTDVQIDGRYLNTNLEKVSGHLQIRNKSGEIFINDLAKNLNIEGEYLTIEVKKFKGESVEIYNRSEDVSIESIANLTRVTIENQYGDVSISMEKPFNGLVQFENEYGDIDTNLKLSDRVEEKKNNHSKLVGKSGEVKGLIQISNKSGDISVTQN